MTRPRVAITGASGQLGRSLLGQYDSEWNITGVDSRRCDVRDWAAVRDWVASVRPDVVIHAAAATNVDGCEREPRQAYAINALGTRNVAQAAARAGADLVYVSTNYVFDGQKDEPYHEFDVTAPISVYGASKLAGEREATAATERVYVVRTAMVFAKEGANFVSTMRRLMSEGKGIRVVNDQFGNPTYAPDLAAAIGKILERAPFGIYHVTNQGIASWHDWATAIAEIEGFDSEIEAIPASEYQRDAQPPANGALESMSLPALSIELPDWRDALQRCLGDQ